MPYKETWYMTGKALKISKLFSKWYLNNSDPCG